MRGFNAEKPLAAAVMLAIFAVYPAVRAQAQEVLEEVVVTGIRYSIQRAQDIKRNADAVVDALTTEDLGKFADENIGDGLQRIPGVQLERNDGGQEGDRVAVRGLGPQFTTATVNGRTLFSSGTEGQDNLRSFNFDVLPPNVFAGITVQKTSTASNVASGLAGHVDLQLLKPKDIFSGRASDTFFSVTARGDWPSISEKLGYRGNGIAAFRKQDGAVSGYVAGLYGKSRPSRNQQLPRGVGAERVANIDDNGDGVADRTQTITSFDDVILEPIRDDRERISLAGALQLEPSEDLSVVMDAVYTEFNNRSFRNRTQFAINGAFTPTTVINANSITVDENGVLQAADFSGFSGGGAPGASLLALKFDNFTDTTLLGTNIDWRVTDKLNVNVDLYYSKTEYRQDLDFPIINSTLNPANVRFATGEFLNIDLGPEFLENTAGRSFGLGVVRDDFFTADDVGARIDFVYDFHGDGIIQSLEWGARYAQAEVDTLRTQVLLDTLPSAGFGTGAVTPEQAAAALAAVLPGGIADFGRIFPQFPVQDLDAARAALPSLSSVQSSDPAASFNVKEDIFSLYGEANFLNDSETVRGNLGLRLVRVETTGTGASIDGATIVPITVSESYTELLPSLNVSYSLADNVVLRLALSRTITRPDPSQLAPRISIAAPIPGQPRTAQFGNPDLDPLSAWNFDATVELYTPNEGAVVLSLFRKEVEDFILPQAVNGTLPGQGNTQFLLTQPVNFSDGTVGGFEIGFNQPLDFILAGFGIQANYTFVDSSFDEEVGDFGFGFPGAAENNFNTIIYYENYGFGARLGYTFRDQYFASLPGQGAQAEVTTANFIDSQGIVNLNFSYDISDDLKATLEAVNLTAEGRRDFIGFDTTFGGYFERERTIILGLTANF